MAHIVKYYSGILHAQFETSVSTPVYALMHTAAVELQPRFVLEKAIEINADEYENISLHPPQPFIQRKLTEGIELHYGPSSAKRVTLKEVTLLWTEEDVKNKRVWTFMAEKNGRRHGRLQAKGVVAVVENVPDPPSDVIGDTNRIVNPPTVPPAVHASPNQSNATNVTIAPTPSLMSRGGCSPLRGMGGGMPRGCGRGGCGLLAVIPLLLVLLGMLRQCQQGGPSQSNATIIHDTVYVDRVEQRIDTLTLFKTDTVQMV
ncbi:MAG: hypothetical protein ACKOW8_08610, partial [Flavobacteriales bacterium]